MNKNRIESVKGDILIVDDTPSNLNLLRQTLEAFGYNVIAAPSGKVALQIATRTPPDLILLDVMMPGIDGFETCRRLKAEKTTADIPVIFITARDETESLVEGFQVGGVDYITKPFKEDEVRARVGTHLKMGQLTKELVETNAELKASNERLKQEIATRQQAERARDEAADARQKADDRLSLISQREAERWGIDGFIGKSKTIGKILTDIRRLHRTGSTNVLITGESGTGKELIARAIHFGGPRAKSPFIPVNCSAIPSELAESLFFGHVKGAFTGANMDKKGYFELADGGTLFLDEIGDMPLEMQAKLLRILEDGYVTPIGGAREKRVDVRILSATNSDLQKRMVEGAFREDLYYRLAGFTVVSPPLRERPEDIPLLADHFLSLFASEMGVEKPALRPDALAALTGYPFPGNARELKNIIERSLIEGGGNTIIPEHLHFQLASQGVQAESVISQILLERVSYSESLDRLRRRLVENALRETNGNRTQAAKLLGMGRPNLTTLIKRLGLIDLDP
jgi:DNA-binding NtrC family response regulator